MFAYRLKFQFIGKASLNHDQAFLDLADPRKRTSLKLISADSTKSIKDANEFLITGSGYNRYDEAYESALNARHALMWYGVKKTIGVKFTTSSATVTKDYLDLLSAKAGERKINDFFDENGINVFEDSEDPKSFVSANIVAKAIYQARPFVEHFREGLQVRLAEKIIIAYELYHASHFETSPRAKFLTLMMAIECLLERQNVDDDVKSHLDILLAITEQSEKQAIKDLKGRLGELKKESITATGKQFIKKHLGGKEYMDKPAEVFFNDCYKYRGSLVHDGRVELKEKDFSKVTGELSKLVANLLIVCSRNRVE